MEVAGKVCGQRKVLKREKPKVKVQYIQTQPLLVQTKSNPLSPLATVQLHDDEAENVEYLEDCPTEVYNARSNVVDVNDTHEDDDDHFYPNAVHCLISLYQAKYEQMTTESIAGQSSQIWKDISDDMKESYFDFDIAQVKRKYTKLRREYFGISSKEDIEAFYFFTNMHEIYRDKRISAILDGVNAADVARMEGQLVTYVDDILFTDINASGRKEVAFMDMVEKELQAMEQEHGSSNANVAVPSPKSAIPIKHNVEEVQVCPLQAPAKRPKPNETIFEQANVTHVKSEKAAANVVERLNVTDNVSNELTLAAYNAAQQQRHDEKMELLRRSLQLQERVLDMQHSIMEQLLKRI